MESQGTGSNSNGEESSRFSADYFDIEEQRLEGKGCGARYLSNTPKIRKASIF